MKGKGRSDTPPLPPSVLFVPHCPKKVKGIFMILVLVSHFADGTRENEKRAEVIPPFIMQKNSRPTVSRNSITCYIKAGGCPPA